MCAIANNNYSTGKATSGASDYNQYVFPHDCALEVMRTQGARKTLTDTPSIDRGEGLFSDSLVISAGFPLRVLNPIQLEFKVKVRSSCALE